MLIDLHCHTFPRSQCSSLEPGELAAIARKRGLDGVCLTEHDTAWPGEELAAFAARTGLLVLAGIELSTDMGHILAYGLSDGSASLATAAGAAEAAAAQGAILFLAHPARDGMLRADRRTVDYFASVEAINGSDSRLQNMAATGLAHGFRHPGIGGSDAHSAAEVGRAATRFLVPVTDTGTLVAALRAGQYEAVALE